MTITRNKGIKYSEYIVETVNEWFADETKISGYVETFYNCREQGYVLRLHDEDYAKNLCIWICAQRNSDDPMITWEDVVIPKGNGNMFTEEGYYNSTECFDKVDDAVKRCIEVIKNHFEL